MFSNGAEVVGKLYKRQMDPKNIAEFQKANYAVQGTVKYDAWIAGAFAGLSLLLGEHMIGPEDREELTGELEVGSPTDPILHSTVELTGDGSGVAAVPVVDEETRGLTPPGSPEVASETIVPSAETPAVSESHGGLTPSRSPEVASETIVPTAELPAVSEEPRVGDTGNIAAGAASP